MRTVQERLLVVADRLDAAARIPPGGASGLIKNEIMRAEALELREVAEASARPVQHLVFALEASARPAPQGWQVIENCPKDGHPVMLFSLHWRDGGKPVSVPAIGSWSQHSNCFVSLDGEIWRPTHWMPLPDPPSVSRVLSTEKEDDLTRAARLGEGPAPQHAATHEKD